MGEPSALLVHTESGSYEPEGMKYGSIEPGAVSSAAERHVHTVEVSGSIPLPPTKATRTSSPRREIYFVQADTRRLIKIGVSNCAARP